MAKVKKVKKTITLQTRGIDIEVKEHAEKVAREKGFSTLQDAVRLFVHQMAERSLDFRIEMALQQYENGEYITIKPGENIRERILSADFGDEDDEELLSTTDKGIF